MKHFDDAVRLRIGDSIENSLSFLARGYQAVIPQPCKMLGERGPG